jgi:hypothetical protein
LGELGNIQSLEHIRLPVQSDQLIGKPPVLHAVVQVNVANVEAFAQLPIARLFKIRLATVSWLLARLPAFANKEDGFYQIMLAKLWQIILTSQHFGSATRLRNMQKLFLVAALAVVLSASAWAQDETPARIEVLFSVKLAAPDARGTL